MNFGSGGERPNRRPPLGLTRAVATWAGSTVKRPSVKAITRDAISQSYRSRRRPGESRLAVAASSAIDRRSPYSGMGEVGTLSVDQADHVPT